MSLREYEDFVYGATYADQDDPVQCWNDLHDVQQRYIDWLAGKDKFAVRGPQCGSDAFRWADVPGSTATASAICPAVRSLPAR